MKVVFNGGEKNNRMRFSFLLIKLCGNCEHDRPGVHFISSFILGTLGMRQDRDRPRMGWQSITQSFKPSRVYDLRHMPCLYIL